MAEKNSWLHLGLGSFHRAHQACYFNHLLAKGESEWQFFAGNIRSDAEATVQGMLSQGCKYTLETIAPDGKCEFETITAISKVFAYEDDLHSIIECGAAASTKVISFTVTEAGYYLDAVAHLDVNNEFIKQDIAGGVSTIYGAIAHIIRARRQANGDAKLTLLCCDNVRENGEKFHSGMVEFFKAQGAGAAEDLAWFEANTTTPNTMVDRITPRPPKELAAEIKEKTGMDDAAPVMSEAFIQWVVEDNFAAGRPALEKVGAQMVDSVVPYEDAKLRILNASHSCLAWAGVSKAHKLVFECARDSELYKYAYDYITDCVIPCLKAQNSPIDLEQYRDTTLDRFRNDHLRDQLERIAQDSFSKFYTFVKPTVLDCYRFNVDPTNVVFLAALYYVFLEKVHVEKNGFSYQDSSFDPKWYEGVCAAADKVQAFADTKLLFDDLGQNKDFVQLLRAQIERARAIH